MNTHKIYTSRVYETHKKAKAETKNSWMHTTKQKQQN